MIVECTSKDIDKVLEYINDDYGKCLYMYIDLVKYGLDNENFKVWIQTANDSICAVLSKYYNGIQVYSKSNDFIVDEVIEFINGHDPSMVSAMEYAIERIEEFLPEYEKEVGTVARLKELTYEPFPNAYLAPFEELEEIAHVIAQDDVLGKPYGYELLYEQYCERKKDKFGRNFILRDEGSDEIICHAATYAELSNLGVVSGVLTTPKYRGKGFSKGTLAALAENLLSEGKGVFSYFYIPAAERMHYGIGFEKIGDWAKLTRK